MGWQKLFDNKPGRTVEGDGFTVRLFSEANLRYSEGNRALTLLTEVVDESDRLGRKWFILPRVVVVVYVPAKVRWDDGNEIELVEVQRIVARISAALENKGEVYRIEPSDAPYQQAQRDWEKLRAGGVPPEQVR